MYRANTWGVGRVGGAGSCAAAKATGAGAAIGWQAVSRSRKYGATQEQRYFHDGSLWS